ncbi:MAG: [FeFe] hydrogenase, group A [Oscillospiraceae bacterium]|nr:[FeFe] hydrogenase, group A [Oscillospiraceae bacterium]
MAENIIVDNLAIEAEDDENLLELIRRAGIDLPTFCYHSEISVYGACRMCMVEVEGRGIVPACSTRPEPGMVIKTHTSQIRDLRKMIIELMLANHDPKCTTCPESGTCRLQSIATQLGVRDVRFNQVSSHLPIDNTSEAIVRDPSKCILCGDCVRVCGEIQSVGALDFTGRGADAQVVTYFNKGMGDVECVNCGQCVKVCPVGALTAKYHISQVWDAVYDESKTVVVQIAPAVRVALGDYFGEKPGALTTGKIITSLRRMGFDRIYDTCFAADFTVVEEGREFLSRYSKGENLPLFTSCCPAWVKFAEQYYPDLLDNLSTCRSPMMMFGSLCKDQLSQELGVAREDIVMVSIMPCTAKKFEASRPELSKDGNPDVDFVLTTKELAIMMQENGIEYDKMELGSFDMPYGFYTGAAVIFGASGGVSEAVLRFAAEELNKGSSQEFHEVRSSSGVKVATIQIGEVELKLAVVSGLANARALIDRIRNGEEHFDLVEVMACPGGCVNGGGQPVADDYEAIAARAKGLYDSDKMLQFHNSSQNPYLKQIYHEKIDEEKAHELLHTHFENRKRIHHDDFVLGELPDEVELSLSICFGTSCYLRGAQELYNRITEYIRENGLEKNTEFKANFCGELCKKGPTLIINGKVIEHCTYEIAIEEIQAQMAKRK